jgi:hypothetical protein
MEKGAIRKEGRYLLLLSSSEAMIGAGVGNNWISRRELYINLEGAS